MISSKNLSSSSSWTQKRIRVNLVKILFIYIYKDLYFWHANTWWIKITTKICYLIFLQVKIPRRKVLIYSCIWNWFGRETWGIIFVFNYHLLWYPYGLHYLWYLMCWFRNLPYFSFFWFFWLYTSSYFKIIITRTDFLMTLFWRIINFCLFLRSYHQLFNYGTC